MGGEGEAAPLQQQDGKCEDRAKEDECGGLGGESEAISVRVAA